MGPGRLYSGRRPREREAPSYAAITVALCRHSTPPALSPRRCSRSRHCSFDWSSGTHSLCLLRRSTQRAALCFSSLFRVPPILDDSVMTLCSLCHSVSLRRPCARVEPACAGCCRRHGGCTHHTLAPRDSDRVRQRDLAGAHDPPPDGDGLQGLPPQLRPQQQQQQRQEEQPLPPPPQQQQQQQPDLVALFRSLQESITGAITTAVAGAITSALRPGAAHSSAVQSPSLPNAAEPVAAPAQLPPATHLDAFSQSPGAVASVVSGATAELRASGQVSHTSHNSSGALTSHVSIHLSGGAVADAAWLASAPIGLSPQSPLKATKAPNTASQLSASLRAWLASGKLSPAQHRPWDEYIRQTVEYAHLTSTELALEYHHAAMGRFKADPRTYDPALHGPIDHVSYMCVLHPAVARSKERPVKRSRLYPARSDRGASPPPYSAKRRGAAGSAGDPDSTSDAGRGQRHFCEHHQRLVFHTSDNCSIKGKKAAKAKSEGSG